MAQDDEKELRGEMESRIDQQIEALRVRYAGNEWLLVRVLVDRALHLAGRVKGVEFCNLATYLGQMVGHAHELVHGGGEAHRTENVH